MVTNLVLTGLALLIGLGGLRYAGGRRRAEVGTADLAVVLAGGEIAQVLYTLTMIDVRLGLPFGSFVVIMLVCGGMVVGGVLFPWMGTVVTGVGLVAALVDSALNDGVDQAAALLLVIVGLWLLIRLLRLLIKR